MHGICSVNQEDVDYGDNLKKFYAEYGIRRERLCRLMLAEFFTPAAFNATVETDEKSPEKTVFKFSKEFLDTFLKDYKKAEQEIDKKASYLIQWTAFKKEIVEWNMIDSGGYIRRIWKVPLASFEEKQAEFARKDKDGTLTKEEKQAAVIEILQMTLSDYLSLYITSINAR
jgi:hypothetical protein